MNPRNTGQVGDVEDDVSQMGGEEEREEGQGIVRFIGVPF